jgi:hypothetical protein
MDAVQKLSQLRYPRQQHCEYNVEVVKTSRWTVQRRYKEFEALLAAVKNRRRTLVQQGKIESEASLPLPELPRKRYFKFSKNDPAFIAKRRRALDEFVKALLACPESVSRCPEVVGFLTTLSRRERGSPIQADDADSARTRAAGAGDGARARSSHAPPAGGSRGDGDGDGGSSPPDGAPRRAGRARAATAPAATGADVDGSLGSGHGAPPATSGGRSALVAAALAGRDEPLKDPFQTALAKRLGAPWQRVALEPAYSNAADVCDALEDGFLLARFADAGSFVEVGVVLGNPQDGDRHGGRAATRESGISGACVVDGRAMRFLGRYTAPADGVDGPGELVGHLVPAEPLDAPGAAASGVAVGPVRDAPR